MSKDKKSGIQDLIEALFIFSKYDKDKKHYPTHCEHDVLSVCVCGQEDVEPADYGRLYELGFFWSEEDDAWSSFRFGSC